MSHSLRFYHRYLLGILLYCAISGSAYAAIIQMSLGNIGHGLSDGDTPTTVALSAIQSGQPVPFDTGIGSDVLAFLPNSATWTFNYATIVDPILSATLSFGIADHDSAGAGSQLDSFILDGTDFTTTLDALFEGSGGGDMEFNIYSLNLSATIFASLADGSFTAFLDLGGSGLALNILTGQIVDTAGNGFHLLYSTLTINTRDSGGPTPVPEPAGLLLFALATLALSGSRLVIASRRRR